MKLPSCSRWLAVAGLALLLGPVGAPEARQRPVRAIVSLAGCADAAVRGTAKLIETPSGQGVKTVKLVLKMQGMPRGHHGVHIHETANCTPCTAAGGHFDPGPNGNSSPDGNHPYHLGDLVNIKAKANGKGVLKTTTTRVTLSDGPLTLFDFDGSAVIVHANPDTFCPNGGEAGCAGGGRIACGVIQKIE